MKTSLKAKKIRQIYLQSKLAAQISSIWRIFWPKFQNSYSRRFEIFTETSHLKLVGTLFSLNFCAQNPSKYLNLPVKFYIYSVHKHNFSKIVSLQIADKLQFPLFLRIFSDKCKQKISDQLKQQKPVFSSKIMYLQIVEFLEDPNVAANHLVRIRKGILNLESSLNRNTFSIRKKIDNA